MLPDPAAACAKEDAGLFDPGALALPLTLLAPGVLDRAPGAGTPWGLPPGAAEELLPTPPE